MEYRTVSDGRFKVNDEGDVIRVRNGKEGRTTINYLKKGKKYARVTYYENNKQTHYYVHRLVADAFLPNPNSYPQINHKDGNPRNNHVDNLEWCTGSQNMQHARSIGLIIPMRNAIPCTRCSKLTRSKHKMCWPCRRKVKRKDFDRWQSGRTEAAGNDRLMEFSRKHM